MSISSSSVASLDPNCTLPPEILSMILEYFTLNLVHNRSHVFYRRLLFVNKCFSILVRKLLRDKFALVLATQPLPKMFKKFKNIYSNPYLPLTIDRFWATLPKAPQQIHSALIAQTEEKGILKWTCSKKLWSFKNDDITLFSVKFCLCDDGDGDGVRILLKDVTLFEDVEKYVQRECMSYPYGLITISSNEQQVDISVWNAERFSRSITMSRTDCFDMLEHFD